MTDLSPAAQAVLDAFRAVPDLRDCPSIAGALRAAADQVVPEDCLDHHSNDSDWQNGFIDANCRIRTELLTIAAELEGAQ